MPSSLHLGKWRVSGRMYPTWMARLAWLILACSAAFLAVDVVQGNTVFPVHHKFKGTERNLSAWKAHDVRRHRRLLFDVDLELGGLLWQDGLYFAKIGIGSPSKDYYVLVDTGSDILWVNCVGCTQCPKKSELGIELTLYDVKSSSTSSIVTCDQHFCTQYGDLSQGCTPGCGYSVQYGDGSTTSGYFVQDNIQLEKVTGNLQTAPANVGVTFGCGTSQTGNLITNPEAVDGIIGFGQASSSMISQLASAGEVQNVFAHCLDNVNGGGIFAIGQVVSPEVNRTPLVANQDHYNVMLTNIEVGGDALNLPFGTISTELPNGVIIDSGTTLAYLPNDIYAALLDKIKSGHLEVPHNSFTCFAYNGNVDDGFPVVTLYFSGSLSLTVHPHDYLFEYRVHKVILWCVGWQQSDGLAGDPVALLGDMVLSNKLVLYDLKNQEIGWTEYNCSSSIMVKDKSGAVYSVGAHNISLASTLIFRRIPVILLLLIAILHYLSY